MIKFKDISKKYCRECIALDNVSFDVEPKEFVSVVGKSGAGKTTLFKLLIAEERPTGGELFFDNQNVNKLKYKHLPELRRQIGAVFQDYKLLETKNAFENVAYVLEVMGVSDKEIKRDVVEVLDIVGLSEKADNFPAQLSGGENQRLAIARALIHRPQVILADEPTGNLDPYHTSDIIELLLKINEMGTTIILATHNKDIINALGKRVITLYEGRVVRDDAKGKFMI